MQQRLEVHGVTELSEAEQRLMTGGGVFEDIGYAVGWAAGKVVEAAKGFYEASLESDYTNPRYDGTWMG